MLREHLGYISDRVRLELFRKAIGQEVRPGTTVADAGCGFGVLGLMCLQAGAAHVWGIDRTTAIEIARETMAKAGFGTRYSCIAESSFRAELPTRVDMLVCDHVGYFGIDYGIIEMIADARRRLLKPGGVIMPRRIGLMLAGASSRACRDKAEAWSGQHMPQEFGWLREYQINTKQPANLAREDIRTRPVELASLDLGADIPDYLSFKTSLTVERDGVLDGLAGWFDCELAAGIRMTNSPLADGRIDREQVFLAFDQPIEAVAGDCLDVSVSLRHKDGILAWSVKDPRSGKRQRQSTWASLALGPRETAGKSGKALSHSAAGRARKLVLDLVDGERTGAQIEEVLLRDYPELFPSPEEIRRFVQAELARSAQ